MIPTVIVYTSKTGFTSQYARLLGKKLHLPVYSLEDALYGLGLGSPVLYLGWIHASSVQGFRKASKRLRICGVCGVGLCDTGTLTEQVRSTTGIPDSIPLFTLQGGFRRDQLKGLDKLLISMLVKGLSSKRVPTEEDQRMLFLLQRDGDYVKEENLSAVLAWFNTLTE